MPKKRGENGPAGLPYRRFSHGWGWDPKLTVISVWATWCGPCVAELPEFGTMNQMYRGRPFRLVTISLDGPEKQAEAIQVLKENHVAAANYILKTSDHDAFAEALDKE